MNPVVTLVGDAAHVLLPYRGNKTLKGGRLQSKTNHCTLQTLGQGLNFALEDAAKLADGLKSVYRGEKNMSEAVTDYEEDMVCI